jgi:hypothetical protein
MHLIEIHGRYQGWEKSIFFLFKSIFLISIKKIDTFSELNLNVYFQYFQHEINLEDFSMYRTH